MIQHCLSKINSLHGKPSVHKPHEIIEIRFSDMKVTSSKMAFKENPGIEIREIKVHG